MQLDEEFLASKTQLADLCPRKRIDFGLILEDKNSHVGNGDLQCDAFVILYDKNLICTVVLPWSYD